MGGGLEVVVCEEESVGCEERSWEVARMGRRNRGSAVKRILVLYVFSLWNRLALVCPKEVVVFPFGEDVIWCDLKVEEKATSIRWLKSSD